MSAAAGTGVIVSDCHDPDRVVYVFGKPPEVKTGPCLFPGHEGLSDRHIGTDHVVDPLFDFQDLFIREGMIESVITFGFLFFYMGTEGSPTIEHSDHGLIQDMFSRMHSGVWFFFHHRMT